jgi:predicted MFS family arabinose efflux permease
MFTDAIPLMGTRRRHYLLLGVGGGGLFWLLLGIVPQTYHALLVTYTFFYVTVVLTSTSLGGRMVEVSREYLAAGRLTAQRIGTFKIAAVTGGIVGGWLASKAFGLTTGISASLHFMLFAFLYRRMKEPPTARKTTVFLGEVSEVFRKLIGSKVLMSAAGMVILIAASPGFGTPLFFYQTNSLHFSKPFVGFLTSWNAAFGIVGAWIYYLTCRRLPVQVLLYTCVVVHALGTITFLSYHSHTSSIVITALAGISGTMAMLPVYDLAARATPAGAEAIGYAVMMSVWNFTNAFSDWTGSKLFDRWKLTFHSLVWLNAGTTALVLFVIPLLPAALLRAKDGDSTGLPGA